MADPHSHHTLDWVYGAGHIQAAVASQSAAATNPVIVGYDVHGNPVVQTQDGQLYVYVPQAPGQVGYYTMYVEDTVASHGVQTQYFDATSPYLPVTTAAEPTAVDEVGELSARNATAVSSTKSTGLERSPSPVLSRRDHFNAAIAPLPTSSLSSGSAPRTPPKESAFRSNTEFEADLEDTFVSRRKRWAERKISVCIPKKRTHRIICCSVILLFFILAGVLLGLFIPRYPQISIYDIELADFVNGTTPFSFTFTNPSLRNLNQLRLQMNLTMALSTYNPNLYPLYVDSIDLNANIVPNVSVINDPLLTRPLIDFGSLVSLVGAPPAPATPKPANYLPSTNSRIGTGSYGRITFPSKSSVNYTMTFVLDYTPDEFVGLLQDPSVLEIADACGITDRSSRRRTIQINYQASAAISTFKNLGFTPSLGGVVKIQCPFSKGQIDAVISKVVDGKEDVYQAISEVFGGGNGGVSSGNTTLTVPEVSSSLTTSKITSTATTTMSLASSSVESTTTTTISTTMMTTVVIVTSEALVQSSSSPSPLPSTSLLPSPSLPSPSTSSSPPLSRTTSSRGISPSMPITIVRATEAIF
ncbi:hypothetical protein BC830DRAFT_465471 [Chytriomyces sp. MP71]|nr:hypothetical protein BC830DRAFT_465471 [Chytriomyces sp. MP71]